MIEFAERSHSHPEFDPDQYEPVEPLGEWDAGDIYHEQPGISNSQLKVAEKSMRLFERMYVTGEAEKDYARENSTALLIGNVVHTMILEPEKLSYRYVPEPDFSDREFLTSKGEVAKKPSATSEYKALMAEWEEQYSHCQVVKRADWETALKCVESFNRSEDAQALMARAQKTEVPFRWKDHKRKCVWKVMLDVLLDDDEIVDLKTCASVVPSRFIRNVHDFRYLGSMAIYALGYKVATGRWPKEFYLVAIEKSEPYDVVVYRTMKYFPLGWKWVNKWMEIRSRIPWLTIAECVEISVKREQRRQRATRVQDRQLELLSTEPMR